MTMKRWMIVLGAVLGIGAGAAVFAFATRSYPVMIVNGTMIPMGRFEKNYASAMIYRDNLIKSSAEDAEAVAALSETDPAEIELGVLDQLVTAVLIRQTAEQELGNDRAALVEEKLAAYRNDPRIRQGVLTLYGMRYEDFEREVLTPQAERDMLAGRLFLRNENIEDVLSAARKSASIRIFSSRFRWDGERVVAN